MPTFIESCCCRGIQPVNIVEKRRISRPEAVGMLLKDRDVPRFIIAPDGYGKTHVAFEYASIMFAFEHVIWIKCTSPCFIRDLDSSQLYPGMLAADEGAALVIFDGLPALDPKRTQRLSGVIDSLVKAHCEVIITCAPASDTFEACQRDRVVVTSKDLLLDDSLMEALGKEGKSQERIPCLAWGHEGFDGLLEGCAAEEMPTERRAAIFFTLAVGRGDVSRFSDIFEEGRATEVLESLDRYYTYAGVDTQRDRFEAVPIPPERLKGVLAGSLDEIARCTLQETGDGFASYIADALLHAGNANRAVAFMTKFSSPEAAQHWFERRGWTMLCQGEALSVLSLADHLVNAKCHTFQTDLIRLYAQWALDRNQEVRRGARQMLKRKVGEGWERLGVLSLLVRSTMGDVEPDISLKLAEELSDKPSFERHPDRKECFDLFLFAKMTFPLSVGKLPESSLFSDIRTHASTADLESSESAVNALLWGCTGLLEGILGGAFDQGFEDASAADEAIMRIISAITACLDRIVQNHLLLERFQLSLALLGALVNGEDERVGRIKEQISDAASQALMKAYAKLRGQRREHARNKEAHAERRHAFEQTHPDIFRLSVAKPAMTLSSAPQLEVRMFGGLEVRIDGEMVDPRKLSRKRTKTLVSVLALNKGREISQDRLCQLIWPDVEADTHRNSFYSVWASLKRALTYGDACPYLIRSQTGCSLDARYLSTDMEGFDALCSSLVFGLGGSSSWEDAYALATTQFSGELLPFESECDYIGDARERCRNRLVDGLIAASIRLGRVDERTGSLWFAREALRRDGRREDVYITLMEAQIAANQRGPALDTYFRCRRFLAEDLGIDPSPRLVELYRSIIEYEEAL